MYWIHKEWRGARVYNDATHVVMAIGIEPLDGNYRKATEQEITDILLRGATKLWEQNGTHYHGWL